MNKMNIISKTYRRNSILKLLLLLLIVSGLSSCQKYLDARPDKTQVVPATLQDLQALLDNVAVMNRTFPSDGEGAADNYYLTANDFDALGSYDKSLYVWQADGVVVNSQWLTPYKVVYYANQVLQSLNEISPVLDNNSAQIKGAALFFRGYAFFQIAGLFSKTYNAATANTDLGIPLRLTSDFNEVSVRSSNEQTYQQILSDLKQSINLLPPTSTYPSRPNRMAAFAAIARTYLAMNSYDQAGLYADSCLALGPQLLDFNNLSTTSANPIARFNQETLFYAMSSGANTLLPAKCKVDSVLYQSYLSNDLRKTIYFKSNGNGSYAFKGNYDGVQSAVIFSGLATDEVYLIRAESFARSGLVSKAMDELNQLLKTRFKTGTFVPLQAADANSALTLILTERRKELIFRSLRWGDLKRLNLDGQFKTTLQRKLGSDSYQLIPNDLRYELLIPQVVIDQSGIQQNAR